MRGAERDDEARLGHLSDREDARWQKQQEGNQDGTPTLRADAARVPAPEQVKPQGPTDTELLDWAEANPEAAMQAIDGQWATCGRGFRERFFGFRAAIERAKRAQSSPLSGASAAATERRPNDIEAVDPWLQTR